MFQAKASHVLSHVQHAMSTPDPVLQQALIAHSHTWGALAGNTHLDPCLQTTLATSSEWPVLHVLVRRTDLTPACQDLLAQGKDGRVHDLLYRHPALTQRLQLHFATAATRWSRIVLAENSALTSEAQCLLAKDPDFTVRMTLARSPHLHAKAAELLSYDMSMEISHSLRKHAEKATSQWSAYYYAGQERLALQLLHQHGLGAEWLALLPTWSGSMQNFLDAASLL